jgi:CHAD domain-containing protein
VLNALREFVLADGAGPPGADALRIEDPRYRISAGGRSRTVRRTWLDTFDWRLFRAGLTLEFQASRGHCELLLTGRDGQLTAAESAPGRPRWPCQLDGLPLGPLREHIAPVIGVRALLPVATASCVLTEHRAVNTDDKTIAVVTVEQMTLTRPCQAAAPDRVSVSALRGYQVQAARLADVLALTPGVGPADRSCFEAALSAAGRRPGDYSGKIDVRLAGSMPAALAVATILQQLFDIVQANLDGVTRDIDTEFLHDLRVAVRRTRAVLKLAGAALPDAMVSRYRPEFKWLGDLTTPTRDLDVYLLGYPKMAASLAGATGPELEPFHDYLRRRRALSQRQLARGIRSARFSALAGQWHDDLDRIARSARRGPEISTFAARRIARAHQRALRSGGAIDASSPPATLHDLRKRCKELRYMLEVFASLQSPAAQWQAVNELKALQDCLGEFQDTEVQRTELREFAEAMMAERSAPAVTLLAMGEIGAALAVRQRAARSEFAGRFAEFASPRGRARFAELTKAAT